MNLCFIRIISGGNVFIGNAKKAVKALTTFDSRLYFFVSCPANANGSLKPMIQFTRTGAGYSFIYNTVLVLPIFHSLSAVFLVRMDCLLVSSPGLPVNHSTWTAFYFFFFFFFWRARVCRPLLRFCRPFMIFEGCLDSNPEYCRSKLARYRLSHPSLSDLATHPSDDLATHPSTTFY